MKKMNQNFFLRSCMLSSLVALFLIAGAFSIAYFLPEKKVIANTISITEESTPNFTDTSAYTNDVAFLPNSLGKGDDALFLYRNPASKNAVESFFTQFTNNREVANVILKHSEKNNISPFLIFALVYTESEFKITAVNTNTNGSTDFGLFQLNSNSFPQLTEAEFFDPETSAKYGVSHFKHCLNASRNNEVAALAMYNAGTARVRAGSTPFSTLNYAGKIMQYRSKLEKRFTDEIVSNYESLINIPLVVPYEK
ncbi:MAG: transglycosylase SLT domain-containing protein [Treponema sp.]|nr:transglycosylase SLT domain-containing protein [Treponema sp.]